MRRLLAIVALVLSLASCDQQPKQAEFAPTPAPAPPPSPSMGTVTQGASAQPCGATAGDAKATCQGNVKAMATVVGAVPGSNVTH